MQSLSVLWVINDDLAFITNARKAIIKGYDFAERLNLWVFRFFA